MNSQASNIELSTSEQDVKLLEARARRIRESVLRVSYQNRISHLGSCLSCVDLLVAVYARYLRVDKAQTEALDRDRFLLGKGHAASALYATLAEFEFFDSEELYTHGQTGSPFEEHPGINAPRGVDGVSGSLGHALSIATGLAKSAQIKKARSRYALILGDGELNEGSVWEAAMFASKHSLGNLLALVDFNRWQGTGRSEEITSIAPLREKWSAFGWQSLEVDGHSIEELCEAIKLSLEASDKPTVIIAHTVKGKGVSFMEDDNNWHYRTPNASELEAAIQEIYHHA